jgi:hypothetical protein
MMSAFVIGARRIAIAAIALGVWSAAVAHAEERVGDWGEPSRIVVEGAKSFSADAIRSALMANFDVLEAGHPLAPLAEYPKLLAEKTKDGYLKAGFRNAKVAARVDDQKKQIVLTVDEGQQFRCGDITLTGTTYFDPGQVRNWLLSKQPPAGAVLAAVSQIEQGEVARWVNENGEEVELQSPAWQMGEPVRFDEQGRKALEENVRRALADLGCRWAKFEIATPQDSADHVAPLQINITEAGPPAVIGKISIVGNQRDSEEDVIKYLGLKPGVMVTESERTRLWYKLWLSGRYLHQTVQLVEPGEPIGLAELQIELKEFDQAPPILEPLSATEQALMKCREWILDSQRRGDDWVLRLPKNLGCLVLSPVRGALVHGAPTIDADKATEFLAMAMPKELTYACAAAGKRLSLPLPDGMRIVGSVELLTGDDPNDPQRVRSLRFGLGLNHNSESVGPPVAMSVTVSPTHMISLAHMPDSEVKLDNDRLIIRSSAIYEFQIDATTGRLIGLRFAGDDESGVPSCEITIEHGAFEREMDLAKERFLKNISVNAFTPSQPLSSIANSLIDDPLVVGLCREWAKGSQHEDKFDRARNALHKAVGAGLLRPLDEAIKTGALWTSSGGRESVATFDIPDAFEGAQGFVQSVVVFARLGLRFLGDAVPRNSWPWVLGRDTILSSMNHGKYYAEDMNTMLNSKRFGPIAHLMAMIPYLCDHTVANGEVVHALGEHALTRLDVYAFGEEIRPLLDQNKLAGKCVCHLAMVLRELDEDDATALGSLFLGDRGSLLGNVAVWLKAFRDEPMEKVLPEILQEAWSAGLRSIIEQRLRAIAGIPFEPVKTPLERAQSEDQSKEKSGSAGTNPEAQRDLDYHLPGHIEVK